MTSSSGIAIWNGVPWLGMRDRLIHGYFGVDYDIVWDAVINKIPALQREVEHILRQEGTA
jgi:uncharacterized protein with HEPN domain